jgi:hypothetical protein
MVLPYFSVDEENDPPVRPRRRIEMHWNKKYFMRVSKHEIKD